MTTQGTPKKNKSAPARHYIDNKKFYTEISKYATAVRIAKEKGEEKPRIPNYVAECIFNIANNLSNLYKFNKYKFKEDLVSDAVLNCIQYIDNFDPDKTNNPFAYFTQVSWYAFLRRIEKEKTYLYTKYKMIENTEIFSHSGDGEYAPAADDPFSSISSSSGYEGNSRENMEDFIANFEGNLKKKKEKRDKVIKDQSEREIERNDEQDE